ncbi:SurA N-terminal domain-containing protein [Qipengyuania sp. XHP0207]|uniref:peptidylprolyl isomerase n=1 Tax=Qipengyuania sp. XHP0207 TaxID=3038078 RepID=UPI00241F8740|nr:peptidylprolyl isomerase [Qipengyuania sp. XHP0207]MDG5747517.1 SurA N-terminal domain-containing protein [Qipengyuania sp. XHP0207]
MLTFFRNIFKTKLGLALALVFLGLIALAFASADVSSTGAFGGVAGGDRVAVVGGEKIGTADLVQAANNGLDRARQQNPTLTMEEFIAQGGLEQSLETLIDRFAIRTYAEKYGIRAGDNLVNSEIRLLPAFRGADGNFSEDIYRQALAQARISDAQAREDFATGLVSQQLFVPATFGAQVPERLAYRYAQLFKERREGTIALLPSASFAPQGDPSPAVLQRYYEANTADFVRPERRIIRFATFDSEALGDRVNPTAAEIEARYQRDREQFAASETRDVTQLIVPTKAAATSLRQRIAGGASFDAVAREAGLRATPLTGLEQSELTSQASRAVADAYFAASEGAITEPARSPLGWHIAQIDDVITQQVRSLEQVREEIATALREEKRTEGLAELAIEIEDQLADGATLTEVAEELNLELTTTRPALANGRIYQAQETLPEVLAPALQTIFQMEEEEPEIAPLQGGGSYLVYEVAQITPAARAPLAEIRDRVEASWRISEGLKRAQAAADRVLKRVRGGATLAAALAAEEVQLPAPEQINLTREQLAARREQRIPPPLALLFSMAEGTTKKLEAAQDIGFFVVDLNDITMDDIADDDPLIAQARQQLGPVIGEEYAQQLRLAMREELGVERNEDAIEAVRRQLLGTN